MKKIGVALVINPKPIITSTIELDREVDCLGLYRGICVYCRASNLGYVNLHIVAISNGKSSVIPIGPRVSSNEVSHLLFHAFHFTRAPGLLIRGIFTDIGRHTVQPQVDV